MSSSPELRAEGLLNRGLKVCSLVAVNCGSGGGLLAVGMGVGVCLLTDSCFRCCFCRESFSLWVRGSSGGRHSTSSIQEWFIDCATVWGRMSPIPLCSPSLKLSDITSTGLRWAGSTSNSSSLSSSKVILSSISCSLLWAASTSMPDPSGWTLGSGEGEAVKGRPICSSLGLVCSWTKLVSDEGVVKSTDHLRLTLGLGCSATSAPSSPISFCLFGLQLPSSVLLLCFLLHLLSQLVFGIDPLVKWREPLIGPLIVSKLGLLKYAWWENMMNSSSLFPNMWLCITMWPRMSWRHQDEMTTAAQQYGLIKISHAFFKAESQFCTKCGKMPKARWH